MVLVRRKKVVFKDVPDLSTIGSLNDATSVASGSSLPPPSTNPASTSSSTLDANGNEKTAKQLAKEQDPDVFYIKQTGEIFLDYDSYAARVSFYKQKAFQCEITSRNNLTFFQALESERNEARHLHARFPECLKAPVLKAVQFQVMGRLDQLTDTIHDRFSNRYFVGEKVFVDVEGDKYYARVFEIFPPKPLAPPPEPSPAHSRASSTSSLSPPPAETIIPHEIGGDLNLTHEEADELDPAKGYWYRLQLIDGKAKGKNGETKWGDSYIDKQYEHISRDRLSFSKSILRRFLRDCVDRSTLVASPWIVKPALASKYGVPTEMSEAKKSRIEEVKEQMLDKRKKWRGNGEEEDSMGMGQDGSSVAGGEEEGGKGGGKGRNKRKIGDIAGGDDKPTTRKKPIKYPAEDLLCDLTVRELKSGRVVRRPTPNKELPFGDLFETFLMSWSCLNSLGKTLTLSSFSLDDFEASLHYNLSDPPHPLLVEINATLLNLIMKDTTGAKDAVGVRPLASYGERQRLLDEEDEEGEMEIDMGGVENWVGKEGLTGERVMNEARKVGYGWATGGELKIKEGRKRWERVLVGCLVERATTHSVPHLLDFLAHLLFTDEEIEDENPSWAVTDDDPNEILRPVDPSQKYYSLHSVYKLEIVSFLCELAVQAKKAKDDMDESTSELTEVRKAIQDVRRERRKLAEEKLLLDGPIDKAALAKLHASLDGASVLGDDDDKMSIDLNGASGSVVRDRDEESSVGGDKASERPDDSATVLGDDDLDLDHPIEALPVAVLPGDEDDEPLSELDESEAGSTIDHSSIPGTPSSANLSRAPSARRETLLHHQLSKEADAKLKSQAAALDSSLLLSKPKPKSKSALSSVARIDEEDARLAKEEDRLDREFRKQIHLPRSKPLGVDRFANKVWWLDGMGSSALIGQGGGVMWGTGRIYIQGGTEEDRRRVAGKYGVGEEEIRERREKEEGEEGMLAEGEWAVYDQPEEMTAFLEWLNPKGHRESKLIDTLKRWWEYLYKGAEKRHLDALSRVHNPTGRTTRHTGISDQRNHPSMNWRNRKADPLPR